MHRWRGFRVDETDPADRDFAPDDAPSPAWRRLVELPLLAVFAILIAFGVKTFVAQAFFIPSESMLPQLEVGDRVVVSRTAYQLHDPNRGDVVVFPRPGVEQPDRGFPLTVVVGALEATGLAKPDEDQLIKRVVGLPGETVEGVAGRVLIDGEPLAEPYLPDTLAAADFEARQVPEGHVFVMGDNRNNSQDSRIFGPVPVDSLVGRAIAVVWPLDRARFL